MAFLARRATFNIGQLPMARGEVPADVALAADATA